MTYEQFTGTMQTLKHAKAHLRLQRRTGDMLAVAVPRNRAINLLNDAEFSLTGDVARNGLTQSPTIIRYSPDLDIRNTAMLAPGLGLRYLEVIIGQEKEFIAKMWHRECPQTGVIVEFGGAR